MNPSSPLRVLLDTLPQIGRVEWIDVKPAREETMIALEVVQLNCGTGLEGDRFSGRAESPRQVTLIQQEHLIVIAACLGQKVIDPALLRRNIDVSGINLLALKDKHFHIGDVLLEFSGACHPCRKMEPLLGAGGYNALRGHGGITACALTAGVIRISDRVYWRDCTRGRPRSMSMPLASNSSVRRNE